jgi:predicted RNase H-like nuclease (RuvC/YqgF family)
MTTEQKNQTWAGVATLLLLLALGWGAYKTKVNLGLETQNGTLILRADSLLAAKGQLEKEIIGLSNDLKEVTLKGETLTASLADVNKTLAQKDRLLGKYQKEARNTQNLERQVRELEQLKGSLNSQLERLRRENSNLVAENGKLKEQVEQLTTENTDLSKKIAAKEDASAYMPLLAAESFRAEVLRKNEKLTVKSRRVRQVDISFDLPQGLEIQGTQTVYMSLRDTKSSPIRDKNNQSVSIELKNGKTLQVTSQMHKEVDFSKLPQRVNFRYQLEERIKAGYYFVELYTDHAYLGSMQFRVM